MSRDLKETVEASDGIVVGQITSHPLPLGTAGPGVDIYSPLTIRVDKSLKGSVVGTIEAEVLVQVFIPEAMERPPEYGQVALMLLVNHKHQPWECLTMMPPTDENISKVKALISSEYRSEKSSE